MPRNRRNRRPRMFTHHYPPNYPATVAEVLEDGLTFKPDALRAIKAFRRSKPWRGTLDERWVKLQSLHAELVRVYRLETTLQQGRQGENCYSPSGDAITIDKDNPSVVTYLHELAHARGADERNAVKWSVNLFRRIFPRSYGRCQHQGHMLTRPTTPLEQTAQAMGGTVTTEIVPGLVGVVSAPRRRRSRRNRPMSPQEENAAMIRTMARQQ